MQLKQGAWCALGTTNKKEFVARRHPVRVRSCQSVVLYPQKSAARMFHKYCRQIKTQDNVASTRSRHYMLCSESESV